jgi:hypothetical protein
MSAMLALLYPVSNDPGCDGPGSPETGHHLVHRL